MRASVPVAKRAAPTVAASDGRTNGPMDGWMDEWTDEWMDRPWRGIIDQETRSIDPSAARDLRGANVVRDSLFSQGRREGRGMVTARSS